MKNCLAIEKENQKKMKISKKKQNQKRISIINLNNYQITKKNEMKSIEEWGEKEQEEEEKMNENFWKTRKRRKKDQGMKGNVKEE